jgi:serine/threonine-protein kinase
MLATPPEWAPGTRIANYDVLEEIARGGQGAVLKAKHAELGSLVAIKVLLDPNEETQRRFRQEAKSLARLRHANLLSVPDFGQAPDGTTYMVMEYVEGDDLRKRVRRDGLPTLEWTVKVLRVVADALHFCHQHGVIHRDVKPQNILIERDTERPLLVDFGLIKRDRLRLAWTTKAEASISAEGQLMGTPAYMPPEQAAPEKFGELSPRTDVYALGATLYYLLTGEAPFKGATAFNVILAVMEQDPVDPRALNPEVPAAVAELCLACLAKDAGRRPPSAEAFGEALRAAASEPVTAAEPRSGTPLWVAAGLVVLGAAGALAITTAARTPGPEPVAMPAATLTAVEDVEEAAQAAKARGDAHVRAGGLAEAVEDFSEAIRLLPGDAAAYLGRGAMRGRLGDHQGAIEDLSEAIRLQPGHGGAHRNRGLAHGKLGDPQAAIADFTEAIRLRPGDAVAYQYRAVMHGKLGDWQGAISDFSEVIRLEHELAFSHRSRGLARKIIGDWQGAIDDLERALELEPQGDRAETTRSELELARRALAEQGGAREEPAGAAESAGRAAEARAALGRGDSHFRAGEYASASEAYSEAIRLRPEDAKGYYKRGIARGKLGDLQGSIEDFSEAIRILPDHEDTLRDRMDAHYNRGVGRGKLGDRRGALEDYSEAIRLQPNHPSAYLNRGLERAGQEDLQGAIEDLTEVIRLQSDRAEAYVNRGVARRELEDRQGAIEDWERALELGVSAELEPQLRRDLERLRQKLAEQQGGMEGPVGEAVPAGARAALERGNSHFRAGEHLKATEAYSEAILLEPDYTEAYYNRGLARSERGEWQKAIVDFGDVIRLEPDRVSAHVSRGLARSRLGDLRGAIEDWERALELAPAGESAPALRENIRRCRQLIESEGGR